MLSIAEARKIGVVACIKEIGYDFCKKHADNATSAYGEDNGIVNCFVGVNNYPARKIDLAKIEVLRLSDRKNDWKYYAQCLVRRETGEIQITASRVPS